MNRNTGMNAGQIIGTMNGQQVVGLDIAKQVFQMHTVDMGTGEIVNVQIKRAKVLENFANLTPCLVAIEACGGAYHWARELGKLGHKKLETTSLYAQVATDQLRSVISPLHTPPQARGTE